MSAIEPKVYIANLAEKYTKVTDDAGTLTGLLRASDGAILPVTNPNNDDYLQFQADSASGAVVFDDPNQALPKVRERVLAKLKSDVSSYLYSRYSQGTQTTLLGLNSKWSGVLINPASTTAQKTTATDRLATLLTVADWMSTVWDEYYTKRDVFHADQTLTTIAYDFTQFDATDPQVSSESVRV